MRQAEILFQVGMEKGKGKKNETKGRRKASLNLYVGIGADEGGDGSLR